MEIKQCNQSAFKGLLYGRMGNHITKGIICCPHGDGKFVRVINQIGKKNPEALKISYSQDGLDKLLIETKEMPKLNLLETIFFIASKEQLKAMRLRKQGKIESFIFKLNEIEYKNLKQDYPFIAQKQLKQFAEVVKAAAPDEMQEFLKKFLW